MYLVKVRAETKQVVVRVHLVFSTTMQL